MVPSRTRGYVPLFVSNSNKIPSKSYLVSSFDKFLFIPLSCVSRMHEQYVLSEMHEQEAIISMVACVNP